MYKSRYNLKSHVSSDGKNETGLYILLGSTGHLGSHLLANLQEKSDVYTIDKEDISDWCEKEPSSKQINFFRKNYKMIDAVLIATGLTGNHGTELDFRKINFFLPRNIIKLGSLFNFKTVTFGSIHELSNIQTHYIKSKRELYKYLISHPNLNHLHFQLHTLFAPNYLKPKSFLGEIRNSIKFNKPFCMSSGEQLRQFHKYDIVVEKINQYLTCDKLTSGIIPLSSQNITSLRDIATFLYKELDCENLLEIDVFDVPKFEIYQESFFRSFPCNLPSSSNLFLEILESVNV